MSEEDDDDILVDDALEAARSNQLDQTGGQTELPEDNDSPAAPSAPVPGQDHWPDDHPSQDGDIDQDEKYQNG